VLDRASTFSDSAVIKLLQTKFIPVAIDQAYQRRQQDAEGRFYQKIVNQGPRKVGVGTTQGHYAATADGKLLGFRNNRGSERTLELLQQSLRKFQPKEVAAIERGRPDTRYDYPPPKGGLVVRTHAKVLGGYEETDNEWSRMFQEGVVRDNFWIRADEHAALAKGEVPESLTTRMARFHLVDNTRGEPPMWQAEDIGKFETTLKNGKLTGTVELKSARGAREFKAELLGFVESKDGRVTRFDVVVKGLFRGEGPYTRGAPKGEFPLAISLQLADGSDVADGIPPQGSRGWLDGYIR
jgi:hypothetical protein